MSALQRPAHPHPTGHRSGKLVVLAIIGLGLVLGVVSLFFRPTRSIKPATQPSTAPASMPIGESR